MKKLFVMLMALVTLNVQAADITGAGATFPYPITLSGQKHIKKKQALGLTINQSVVQVELDK
jgi:hypothetical protein